MDRCASRPDARTVAQADQELIGQRGWPPAPVHRCFRSDMSCLKNGRSARAERRSRWKKSRVTSGRYVRGKAGGVKHDSRQFARAMGRPPFRSWSTTIWDCQPRRDAGCKFVYSADVFGACVEGSLVRVRFVLPQSRYSKGPPVVGFDICPEGLETETHNAHAVRARSLKTRCTR